jgi:lysophospholipase L1-like esterase
VQLLATSKIKSSILSKSHFNHIFLNNLIYLLQQLATPPFANLSASYKLLTIFIGANDVCDFCKAENRLTPEVAADQYEANIRAAIETVYKNIPNTIVNLIPLFVTTFSVTKILT